MRRFFPLFLVPAALVAALAFAACDDDEDDGGANGDGDGAAAAGVDVTLQEWAVVADPDSTAAGDVTFNLTNDGPDDPHEFVIIRSDEAPDALPTDADGAVIEEEVDVVDEVEEIEVGNTAELTVGLDAGSYVLLCNVTEEEDGEIESHYQLGMRTSFTVE